MCNWCRDLVVMYACRRVVAGTVVDGIQISVITSFGKHKQDMITARDCLTKNRYHIR